MLKAQGAGAYGKAGAAVATINDPSAVFYNPAALTKMTRGELYLGGTVQNSSLSYTEEVNGVLKTTPGKGLPRATPHLYLARPLNETFALGLGVFTPYALTLKWPTFHPQSDVVITKRLLMTAISSTLAINFSGTAPGLRAAICVDTLPAQYHLTRHISYGSNHGTVSTQLNGTGFGARIALLYDPVIQSDLHLGITWRSPVPLQLHGQSDFDSPPEHRAGLPTDGDTSLALELPQTLVAGVAYDLSPTVTVELNTEWVQYSTHQQDRFQWADQSESTVVRNWKDALSVRAGVSAETALAVLRAGYEVSTTPVPLATIDASSPDANRQSLSIGAGFSLIEGFTFDIAGVYLLPASRKSSLVDYHPRHKATYRMSSLELIASIGATFGEARE